MSDDNQHLIAPTASKPNPKTWPIDASKKKHQDVNGSLGNDKHSEISSRSVGQ